MFVLIYFNLGCLFYVELNLNLYIFCFLNINYVINIGIIYCLKKYIKKFDLL